MIRDIVEEHLDEAAYLYTRRQAAQRRVDATAEEVADLGRRLRAHLDGLLVGGAIAWELTQPALSQANEAQAFVAGIVAMEGGQPVWLEALVAALNAPTPEAFEGLRWSCLITAWSGAPIFHARLLNLESHWARAIGLDGLSLHGKDPGSALDRGMGSEHPAEVSAALRAASRLRRNDKVTDISRFTASQDPDIAIAALKALARLNPEAARQCCVACLARDVRVAAKAAGVLGGIGNRADVPALVAATRAEDYELARAAVFALGQLGLPECVPALIEILDRPRLGGVATLALREVCKNRLPNEPLPVAIANAVEGAQQQDDWHPDDELPRADKNAVGVWWNARKAG